MAQKEDLSDPEVIMAFAKRHDGNRFGIVGARGVRLELGFDAGESFRLSINPARKGYVHVVRGELEVNGKRLAAGDAAMLQGESSLALGAAQDAEVLVFDLAA